MEKERKKVSADQYDEKEAQERFEKALRGGLKTSPKPLKDVAKKVSPKQKAPQKRG
jgi:hypothetical protein